MLFANRLKELRKDKGLTQDDMANFLCVKRQTYSAYERQISLPDIIILDKLSNFFGVSVDYLLGKTNYKKIINELSASESIVVDESQKELLKKNDDLSPEYQAELKKYADLLKIKQSMDKNKNTEISSSLSEHA
jgi:transcriptional regulator with XRE-family HTH domain